MPCGSTEEFTDAGRASILGVRADRRVHLRRDGNPEPGAMWRDLLEAQGLGMMRAGAPGPRRRSDAQWAAVAARRCSRLDPASVNRVEWILIRNCMRSFFCSTVFERLGDS